VHPGFDTPTDTISDWLKVAHVRNSGLAEIFFFLKEWPHKDGHSAYLMGM